MHFLFKGRFCEQTDGVAMGSPIALVIANFYVEHFEKKNIKNSTSQADTMVPICRRRPCGMATWWMRTTDILAICQQHPPEHSIYYAQGDQQLTAISGYASVQETYPHRPVLACKIWTSSSTNRAVLSTLTGRGRSIWRTHSKRMNTMQQKYSMPFLLLYVTIKYQGCTEVT
jgi:hypothetical protein